MLHIFYRSQLWYLICKKLTHIIPNLKLYKRCKSYPISLFILKACWKLFGHVLRLHRKCPANSAMDYYFWGTGSKHYRCRPRTLTVAPLKIISIVHWRRCNHSQSVDLQRVCKLSQNRILWQNLITNIYKIAGEEKSALCAFRPRQS